MPTPGAFHDSPFNNGFFGFAVGSANADVEGAKLFFTVHAQNSTVPETDAPQVFFAYIDIIDDTTGALLDTQEVVIIVPASPQG